MNSSKLSKLLLLLLALLILAAFTPLGAGLRGKIQCFTESGNCVEGWGGVDIALFTDSGSTNTFNVEGAAGAVRIAVPTTAGTATPGLVIQQGANGNALEVRNSGGTPVASISGGGALSGFGSSGLSVAPNLVVAGPTALATTTPAAIVDNAGVGNLLEVRDSATPVFSVGQAGAVSLAASSVDSTEIANVTREVTFGLQEWIDCETDAGAALNYSSGADAFPDFINSATDGTGYTITFDDTGGSPDTAEICAAISIPPDYASGGALVMRVSKDAETGSNTEVINCKASINGAALGSAGTVTVSTNASTSLTCTPAGTFAAGDSASLTIYITSGGTVDDAVNVHSFEFQYTATQ